MQLLTARCASSYSEVYSVYIQGSPIQKIGDGAELKAATRKERPRGRGGTLLPGGTIGYPAQSGLMCLSVSESLILRLIILWKMAWAQQIWSNIL